MTLKERRIQELETQIEERRSAMGELDQSSPSEKQYFDIHERAIGRYERELEKLKEQPDENRVY